MGQALMWSSCLWNLTLGQAVWHKCVATPTLLGTCRGLHISVTLWTLVIGCVCDWCVPKQYTFQTYISRHPIFLHPIPSFSKQWLRKRKAMQPTSRRTLPQLFNIMTRPLNWIPPTWPSSLTRLVCSCACEVYGWSACMWFTVVTHWVWG